MQNKHHWLLFLSVTTLLLVRCENKTAVVQNTVVSEKNTVDTFAQQQIQEPVCYCEDSAGIDIQKEPELKFSHYDQLATDRLLAKYSSGNRMTGGHIKSLEFVGWDTIPGVFTLFPNVEYVHIRPGGEGYTETSFSGLTIFPKLKGVLFRGCFVKINPNEAWVKNIEVLHLEKSRLSGMESFEQMPKLRDLFVGHSGFEYFPAHFEKLQCLKKAYFGNYRFQKDSTVFMNQKKPACLDTILIGW